ncbi:uncharacterized protein DUF3224 [Pseudonocardia sediminis]|uniref:Uncharacterized protein DUF3224 n=1 Tax=Pseudonocardia sediminis TaxID=1397368 RepID=A0A4Q7UQG9_PSEST|nr:DUF3224 domain-containing protein [Pseudonocardia sediminis]RZT83796.1 uncharacterized protein DUF3224 [Pseudonocardia sediminis]
MTDTTLLTGGFTLPTWDEDPYAEIPADGGAERYVRVRNTKEFTGGLTGTGVADLLQVLLPSGAAAYVGIERVEATVDGRRGTFVLMHAAAGDSTGGSMSVTVVPGSGTGDLDGLRGEMQIDRSPEGVHTYTFDVVLP